MSKEMLPVGLRRDGSYYTRIEWASITESDPCFWVCNVISDDIERSGGTYGAHTLGPADIVLGFFGESQEIGKFRFFTNVGLPISILEELAKQVNIYISNTDEPRKLRTKDDKVTDVAWTKVAVFYPEMKEAWQEVTLDKPVQAKYVRFELVENFGTPPEKDWTEISEIKIYP